MERLRPRGRLLGLALATLLSLASPLLGASLPAPHGVGGAVASDHRLATETGLQILEEGGNAVDAAVATALALAVVFPEAGNLGGGGFAVVRLADGELRSLDFRETAPAAANRNMYLDEAGEPVPEASLVGPLAAGVPGAPAGLFELHRSLGKLPWEKVVAPAVRLAAGGFQVDRHLHDVLEAERDLLSRFPETAQVWLPGGEPPAVGSAIRLPALAATLEDYAQRGPEALQTGTAAVAVVEAASRHGGMITTRDLEQYRPQWRPPVSFRAFGWQVASMALPSSGGVILGQTLGVLERLDWGKLPRFGAERDHLLAEAWRRAYADRFLLGDPDSSEAREEDLLASVWLDRRAREVAKPHATPSGAVALWPGDGPRPEAATGEASDTTHLSVVDRWGNAVALTTTLNGLFGCGLYVPAAGYFLNNEMDDFATAPGRPNLFDLVQGEANAVRPGHRMLSSMSPTVAWKGSEVVALGGRGGSLIPTNAIQVLLHLIADGDPLQAALDRPRLHHQWLPDQLLAEPDALAPETLAELRRRGHQVVIKDRAAKMNAVRYLGEGRVEAAHDPRGTGWAGVVEPGP